MNLMITRSFPPSIGGMQNLMWGLANELAKIDILKVFADFELNHNDFDEKVSFTIERVGGFKIFRKYRKAYLVNEYIKSNIFVMPSIIYKKSVEGFGIAFVEAAQYGVPSIGGKDGGASDAIIHDKTGLICDGNNLDEIYSSIKKLLENKNYIEFGKHAQEDCAKFLWSNIIEKYKRIL